MATFSKILKGSGLVFVCSLFSVSLPVCLFDFCTAVSVVNEGVGSTASHPSSGGFLHKAASTTEEGSVTNVDIRQEAGTTTVKAGGGSSGSLSNLLLDEGTTDEVFGDTSEDKVEDALEAATAVVDYIMQNAQNGEGAETSADSTTHLIRRLMANNVANFVAQMGDDASDLQKNSSEGAEVMQKIWGEGPQSPRRLSANVEELPLNNLEKLLKQASHNLKANAAATAAPPPDALPKTFPDTTAAIAAEAAAENTKAAANSLGKATKIFFASLGDLMKKKAESSVEGAKNVANALKTQMAEGTENLKINMAEGNDAVEQFKANLSSQMSSSLEKLTSLLQYVAKTNPELLAEAVRIQHQVENVVGGEGNKGSQKHATVAADFS